MVVERLTILKKWASMSQMSFDESSKNYKQGIRESMNFLTILPSCERTNR